MLADRGYDADWFRDALQEKGITPCIPGRKIRNKAVKYDKRRYKRRNRIEIMFGRLKESRRVATSQGATPAELAAELDLDPAKTTVFLRALASLGLLEEDESGLYRTTPIGDALRSDHPESARAVVLLSCGEMFWRIHGSLAEGLKQQQPSFAKWFGAPFFEYLEQNPDREQMFAAAMSSVSSPLTGAIVDAYPFADFKLVTDMGGGSGHLLAEALQRNPALRGLVFDLPSVVDGPRARAVRASPDIATRIDAQGGSFFEHAPTGADLYMLKMIIHDWSDEDSVKILGNIRHAMKPDARVLVIETPVTPRNEPDIWKVMSCAMMEVTGGRERTVEEYGELFAKSGLKLSRVIPTAVGPSIIEAVAA